MDDDGVFERRRVLMQALIDIERHSPREIQSQLSKHLEQIYLLLEQEREFPSNEWAPLVCEGLVRIATLNPSGVAQLRELEDIVFTAKKERRLHRPDTWAYVAFSIIENMASLEALFKRYPSRPVGRIRRQADDWILTDIGIFGVKYIQAVGLLMIKEENTLSKRLIRGIKSFGYIFIVLSIFYGWTYPQILSSVYWWWFGFDGNNTVKELRAADFDTKSHFLLNMCDGGICLPKIDWICGFSTVSRKFESDDFEDIPEAIENCFNNVLMVAPLDTKLDHVRKLCGHHYALFHPSWARKPQRCEASGGLWGVKSNYGIEDSGWLVEAGVN